MDVPRFVAHGWHVFDLIGAPFQRVTPMPPVATYDVRRWAGPHAFAIHGHRLTCFVVAFLVPLAIIVLGLPRPWDDAAVFGERRSYVLWVVVVVFWWLRGGYVTLDPVARLVRWHRPLPGWRRTRVWSFDEILGAEALSNRGSVSLRVRVDLGDRRLVLLLPLGIFKPSGADPQLFAATLTAVAVDGASAASSVSGLRSRRGCFDPRRPLRRPGLRGA